MTPALLKAQMVLRTLKDESGQDLVEYAMLIALICLGSVSAVSTLASGLVTAMLTWSNHLNSAVS